MNIKDLFIKRKDEVKPKVPTEHVQRPIFHAPVTEIGAFNDLVSTHDYGKDLDAVFVDEKEPKVGFAEFRAAINKFSGKPIPEHDKYIYAFTPIESMVNVETLIKGGNHYMNKIAALKQTFYNELSAAEKTEITDKEALAEKLKQENIELQNKISKNNAQIQEIHNSVLQSRTTLGTEKHAFDTHYTAKTEELKRIITNIQTYLNANVTK